MKTLRQRIGLFIALALFGAFLSLGATSACAQKAKKTGWWIRIDTTKTQAATIALQVGMTKKDSKVWRTWATGQRMEFDLPAELRNAARLYVHGTAGPAKKHAVFCVFYMDHGVEHFEFDGDVDKNMKQTDSDEDCKP